MVRELEQRLGQFIHRDRGPTSLYSRRHVRLTRVLHVRNTAASISNDWRHAVHASQRECHEARPSHSSETSSVSPSGILPRGISDLQTGTALVWGLRSGCQSRSRAHFGSLPGAWSWPPWSGQGQTTLRKRCEARLSCLWPKSWAAPHSCLPRSRGRWREAQTPCTWRHAVSWPGVSPQLPAVRWWCALVGGQRQEGTHAHTIAAPARARPRTHARTCMALTEASSWRTQFVASV